VVADHPLRRPVGQGASRHFQGVASAIAFNEAIPD
jgi:hypothetical protein